MNSLRAGVIFALFMAVALGGCLDDALENSPPEAVISTSDSEVRVGEPILFSGSHSSDRDGDVLTFKWDFDHRNGIQADSNREVVEYNYSTLGSYRITLRVFDGKHTSEDTITVAVTKVHDNGPTAVTGGPYAGYVAGHEGDDDDAHGLTVQVELNAEDSADDDGFIAEYRWDLDMNVDEDENGNPFDDYVPDGGTSNDKYLAKFERGVHRVFLVVEDNDGHEDSQETLVFVDYISEWKDRSVDGVGGQTTFEREEMIHYNTDTGMVVRRVIVELTYPSKQGDGGTTDPENNLTLHIENPQGDEIWNSDDDGRENGDQQRVVADLRRQISDSGEGNYKFIVENQNLQQTEITLLKIEIFYSS